MSLARGKKKYATKSKTMGTNWDDAKDRMKKHYPSEMARLAKEAGKTRVKSAREAAYKDMVDVVTAADFAAAVAGKEDKWYDNYVDAMFE